MYKFVDIHCHLDDERYDADRDLVVQRLADAGGACITISTDKESSERAIALSNQYENVYACIGVYPVGIHEREADVLALEEMLSRPEAAKVVAIGECGLDYADKPTDEEKAEQKRLFLKQCEIAAKHGKVVMVHCREAYEDFIELVKVAKQQFGDAFRFHMHFFAGDTNFAQQLIDLDATFSFTGVITFAKQYDEVVRMIPEDRLMSETDAPYVTPVPYRGTRNEPVYVQEVIKKFGELRGGDAEITCRENVQRVFGF